VLVDAHCHLGDGAFDADREAVLHRARAAGVGHVVVIGETVAASERAVTLAAGRAGLSATAGVHPHDARDWDAAAERTVRALCARPEVVAVGETGLDYHYDHSPRDRQRAAFAAQLALGAELGMPVVVHAREADDDAAALVREWGPRLPALVLHSFSSGPALFDAGMDVGAYLSFSGMITFRAWTLGDRLTACPPDRLLVETDAPYLAPVPHRGQRNEPAWVRDVAAGVASARGVELDAIIATTTANARRAFGPRLATTLE
jgi:TatD DNase family protein